MMNFLTTTSPPHHALNMFFFCASHNYMAHPGIAQLPPFYSFSLLNQAKSGTTWALSDILAYER